MGSYLRKMSFHMYFSSGCNYLKPRSWLDNIRGGKSIHFMPETDFLGMHVNGIIVEMVEVQTGGFKR